MKIILKESTIVMPAKKTPRHTIWLSSLDLANIHIYSTIVCFYRHNGASNFFDTALLKESLSKALVPFYPIAGRFKHDHNGRLEINCNKEGVLFAEAETNSTIDDLGDFPLSPELKKLFPTVDQSGGVSSFPLLILQVTRFKCGGVSVVVGVEHRAMDGSSAFHFLTSFSEITRGLDLSATPFLDRSLLCPRNPPQVMFNHIEYKNFSSPTMKPSNSKPNDVQKVKIVNFKMTKMQASILKRKAKEGCETKFSTFEILAGHIWKCICKARAQPHDEETTLFFTVNGRFNRLQPPLPHGFFGNVNFAATTVSVVGDIVSKPAWYASSLIHETSVRMDNDYLRSAIDHLESQPDIMAIQRTANICQCPNLAITSWVRLPTHEADFGWGRPFHTGPTSLLFEGKTCIFPSTTDDGSLSLAIALRPEHMKEFEKLFYECNPRPLM